MKRSTVNIKNNHISPNPTMAPTSESSTTTTTGKPTPTNSSKPSLPTKAPSTPSAIVSPSPSPSSSVSNPALNDMQLFNRPSVIGSYNLTLGILVNSFITLAFLITITIATIKRAQFRKQFRRDTEKAGFVEAGRVAASGKGGKGGKDESAKTESKTESKSESKPTKLSSPVERNSEKPASEALPSRQDSIKRALLEDAGSAGDLRRNNSDKPSRGRVPDFYKTRTNDDGTDLGYSNSNRSTTSNRSGNGKQSQPQPQPRNDRARNEMNARLQAPGQEYEPSLRYDFPEDATEFNDYSAPPLSASSLEDAYYSGFAANAQAYQYQYATPQAPQPSYQTPRPLQPVKRSDSNRVNDTQVNRSLSASSRERQKPRVNTQGLVDRNDSRLSSRSNSSSGSHSNSNSPVDRINNKYSRGGSPVANIEMENYPAPIFRSNSARIPNEMKGYERTYAPSGLSQTQTRSGNGNYL